MKSPHLPALDGLRGVAVAAVLAFHAGHLRGGYLGVDLFFVLSGFLITRLLIAEHVATGAVQLGEFWGRRARRLLPALFVSLAGIALWSGRVLPREELGRVRGDAIASLLYVANWRAIAEGNDYWALFSAPSPLEHMWSLAIEEQFYVLWPLLVLLASKASGRRTQGLFAMAAMLLTMSIASALLLHAPSGGTARIYFGTDTRAPAILFGALLAIATSSGAWATSRATRAMVEVGALLGLIVLGVAWLRLEGEDPRLYRGGLLACGVAATAVIASASHPRPGPIAHALSFAPLRGLGNISYGLYLWHWPVFVLLLPQHVGLNGGALTAVRTTLSIVLAIASYYVVERPIRRGALGRWHPALVVATAAGTTVGFVLLGTRGAIDRPPVGTAVPTPPEPPLPPKTPGSPRRHLVVGDSVGNSLRPGADQVEHELGVVVRNRSVPGCGLVRGTQRIRLPGGKINVRADCSDWEQRWAADVADVQPDVVLLVVDAPTIGDLEIDGRWMHPCEPELDAYYERSTARAIEVLGAQGAKVAIATAPYADGRGDLAENRARTDCINAAMRAAAKDRPTARIVELGAWICPGSECRRDDDGIVLRADGTHFTPQAAPRVLAWLVQSAR